jgi:hypothetical protein
LSAQKPKANGPHLPYTAKDGDDGWPFIEDAYGQYVCRCATKHEASALVTAINAHAELLDALELAREWIAEARKDTDLPCDRTWTEVCRAIAQART